MLGLPASPNPSLYPRPSIDHLPTGTAPERSRRPSSKQPYMELLASHACDTFSQEVPLLANGGKTDL